jgi:hypothetical protein
MLPEVRSLARMASSPLSMAVVDEALRAAGLTPARLDTSVSPDAPQRWARDGYVIRLGRRTDRTELLVGHASNGVTEAELARRFTAIASALEPLKRSHSVTIKRARDCVVVIGPAHGFLVA